MVRMRHLAERRIKMVKKLEEPKRKLTREEQEKLINLVRTAGLLELERRRKGKKLLNQQKDDGLLSTK